VANEEDSLMYDIDEKHPAGSVMTGFTIKNAQVNSILLTDPTAFTFRTVEGNEDTATIAALKEAFTKEDYTLNPNVATRNNFISYYNSFVSQIANSGDVYNSIAEAQEQTISSISAAREQIVGVSSDEELEYMIQFQNAYNASSRYINVVSDMLEHLVTTLGA
jgi:flagellar hook-associated protein 1 FlgK